MRRKTLYLGAGAALLLIKFVYLGLPASWHYRMFNDEHSLLQVLSETENGTKLSELEKKIGVAKVSDNDRQQTLLAAYNRLEEATPQAFPDGVTENDLFVDYRAGQTGVTLQIRDDMLVNFEPSRFENPLEPVNVLNPLQ